MVWFEANGTNSTYQYTVRHVFTTPNSMVRNTFINTSNGRNLLGYNNVSGIRRTEVRILRT